MLHCRRGCLPCLLTRTAFVACRPHPNMLPAGCASLLPISTVLPHCTLNYCKMYCCCASGLVGDAVAGCTWSLIRGAEQHKLLNGAQLTA